MSQAELLERARALAQRVPNEAACLKTLLKEGHDRKAAAEAVSQVFSERRERKQRERQSLAKMEQVMTRMLEGEPLDDPSLAELLKATAQKRRAKLEQVVSSYRKLVFTAAACIVAALGLLAFQLWEVRANRMTRVHVISIVAPLGAIAYLTHNLRLLRHYRERLERLRALAAEYGWFAGG
ncbi:MAG: hypothetical protein M5U26_00545 [Planctomycetota bacterium]|nr:hypothetical protein [Planctomycetota bacterium]